MYIKTYIQTLLFKSTNYLLKTFNNLLLNGSYNFMVC